MTAPGSSARENRTSAFVDIVAILASLPIDDSIAIVTALAMMKSSGALVSALGDDIDRGPPPIPLRPEEPIP